MVIIDWLGKMEMWMCRGDALNRLHLRDSRPHRNVQRTEPDKRRRHAMHARGSPTARRPTDVDHRCIWYNSTFSLLCFYYCSPCLQLFASRPRGPLRPRTRQLLHPPDRFRDARFEDYSVEVADQLVLERIDLWKWTRLIAEGEKGDHEKVLV